MNGISTHTERGYASIAQCVWDAMPGRVTLDLIDSDIHGEPLQANGVHVVKMIREMAVIFQLYFQIRQRSLTTDTHLHIDSSGRRVLGQP